MAVYIVVASNSSAEIEVCEAYAGSQTAMGRGWHLAMAKSIKDPTWVVASPPEEFFADGSSRWVFLNTSKNFVAVYYRPTIETALLSKKDPISIDRDAPVSSPTPITFSQAAHHPSSAQLPACMSRPTAPPTNDKLNLEFPGGWSKDGKPILFRDIIDTPDEVKPFDELNQSQKKALVLARINKNPGWVMFVNNQIVNQQEALAELKNQNSSIAQDIIILELNWLDELREAGLES